MRYRDQKTREVLEALKNSTATASDIIYDDLFCGSDVLDLHQHMKLTSDDTTVSFSVDGAQLYQSKKSDTWIAIWVVNNYSPTTRYKRNMLMRLTSQNHHICDFLALERSQSSLQHIACYKPIVFVLFIVA